MINNLASYVAGIATSLLGNYIWEWHKKHGWRKLRKFVPHKKYHPSQHLEESGFLKAGKNVVPWVVCSYGPYERENIEIFYNPHEIKKPAEIQRLYQELVCGQSPINFIKISPLKTHGLVPWDERGIIKLCK
ncbi:hypothetical protein SDD30_14065, partial [Moorella naiadis]|uniref:hypothetical protein n=1 Tax=Moorella naiadis (nom. illeg.) TaxID=3093670 RepID=UPI003D9CACB4